MCNGSNIKIKVEIVIELSFFYTLLSVPWKKKHRLKLLSFYGHWPRKDHRGNLFTNLIAWYGLIPSSTIYAWYLNTKMVPIFNIKKWVMGLLSTLGVKEFESAVRWKFVHKHFYYTVNLLKMLPCNLLNDATIGNDNLV